MTPKALYWRSLEDDKKVQCDLCPQACVVKPGKRGTCKNRGNVDGILSPLIYGKVAAVHMDPIEKKPLYHFCPGSQILSVGFIGCNFHCPFCQNYSLVEGDAYLENIDIDDLVKMAVKKKSVGISFTYNEPLVNFEWVLECAKAFRKAGMRTTVVTNGYLNPEPFADLVEYIEAFNIDLKYSTDENYRKYSGAKKPEAIKDNIKLAHEKAHVEVTHLLVTGINDNEASFTGLVEQVAEISPDIPLHISRYHPMYKYREPATPLDFMEKAHKIAAERLRHVYLGNVSSDTGASSYCRHCGAVLVERSGYSTRVTGLDEKGVCAKCGGENNFVYPCDKS